MVYIAGDNNPSANSIAIMQDLEEAGRSSDVRVVAGYDSSAPFHKGARYLEIQHKLYEGNYPINWGLHNDMVYPAGHLVVAPDFCNEQPATIKPRSLLHPKHSRVFFTGCCGTIAHTGTC